MMAGVRREGAAQLDTDRATTAEAAGEAAEIASRVPTTAALDDQVAGQRLFLIRICAAPLMLCGVLWTTLLISGVLGEPAGGFAPIHSAAPVAVAMIGAAAYILGSRGKVRAAATTLIIALLAIASISMVAISNVELTSVIAYCVAMSIAAITLDRRELGWVAAAVVITATLSALLNQFPVVAQMTLPPDLRIAATLAGTILGLPYPMLMFWLISNNLSASRQEAWQAARAAANAARIIDRRTEELELLTEQLESKNSELSDFLYVVSHDLRAPLINLDGFSRALEESLAEQATLDTGAAETERRAEIDGEIAESLGFIRRSVDKMDFLVRAVLDLSRIQTRAGIHQAIDTDVLVTEILDTFHFTIDQRGIEIAADPLPEICGDPIRVHQIFSNLLDNAIKYLNPTGDARIEIRCVTDPDEFHFAVKDNSIGIRSEDQARVFRLFTRLGRSTAGGDGIGLTSVRKIVEQEGGRIWIKSAPGRGSEFHFTWPRSATGSMEDHHDAAA